MYSCYACSRTYVLRVSQNVTTTKTFKLIHYNASSENNYLYCLVYLYYLAIFPVLTFNKLWFKQAPWVQCALIRRLACIRIWHNDLSSDFTLLPPFGKCCGHVFFERQAKVQRLWWTFFSFVTANLWPLVAPEHVWSLDWTIQHEKERLTWKRGDIFRCRGVARKTFFWGGTNPEKYICTTVGTKKPPPEAATKICLVCVFLMKKCLERWKNSNFCAKRAIFL